MSASTFFKPEDDSVLVLKKKSRSFRQGRYEDGEMTFTIPTLLYIPSEKLAIYLDGDDQLLEAKVVEEIPVADESLRVYNEKLTRWLEQQKKMGNKNPKFPQHSELLTAEEYMLGYEKIYLSSERVSNMVYAAKPSLAFNR